jgi:hypothetical protein
MTQATTFARRVFFWAGIYGIVVLSPQYLLENALGQQFPPPLTHPEHFYGFIGVALAWQFAFLLIARDVVRYRLFMLPAAAEKLLFALAAFVLYAQGRVAPLTVGAAVADLALATMFLIAFHYCGKQTH